MNFPVRESRSLQGRTALVTGGGRGIGRAIALELASHGARVGVNYVADAKAAESAVAEILAAGGDAKEFGADVGQAESAAKLVAEFLQWTGGRVDILVNNAGITRDGLLMRISDADWDAVLDTNLKGAFLVTRAVSRTMLKQRFGRIVNIASVVGLMGNAGQSSYAASKAGLLGLTKSLAKELGSRNILVNAVAPGFINSEMTACLDQPQRQRLLDQLPLGRFGEPHEVAALVAFLVAEGTYITGQVFNVDGGMLT